MNHERMTLQLAVCFVMVVALMTANGLTGTTMVYAAHGKHSSNHTSSSSRGNHDNTTPSSSTSGSGVAGSTDSSGNTGNPPPSSGTGTATGSDNTGTGTGTNAAPTITPPTTTKKTTGNNPCLTSMPPTSCGSTGTSGSTDNSGTGSTGNPPPSSGTGTPTGSSGTGTGTGTGTATGTGTGTGTHTGSGGTGKGTNAAPTITPPTTTKKTTGNNPCLTSSPPTSCSSTGTSGSSGNQSQNNHQERHHTGGGVGSTPNAFKPNKHYDTGLGTRHQNSSMGTPSGPGTGSNRTHDGPHAPKTGDNGRCTDSHFGVFERGCGEQNGNGRCTDSHFGVFERGCGEGTHCVFIEGHGLFCRHGFVGGESHGMKHEGDTKVEHETEIKVTHEHSSAPYNGPSSVVLLSPTSNDYVNNNPTTISVDHVTITSNGEQWWIKGTVTNNSNQTMHGLRITGTWYDSGNNTMGISSSFVSGLNLNPGQHGTFSEVANYNIGRTPSTVELSYDWQ